MKDRVDFDLERYYKKLNHFEECLSEVEKAILTSDKPLGVANEILDEYGYGFISVDELIQYDYISDEAKNKLIGECGV